MSSILELFRLDGKVAIITGAGRGLGAAIARGFADAGADVVISARTADDLADEGEASAEQRLGQVKDGDDGADNPFAAVG